jgi:hypothetical protein
MGSAAYCDASTGQGYVNSIALATGLVTHLSELLDDKDIVGGAERPASWMHTTVWYKAQAAQCIQELTTCAGDVSVVPGTTWCQQNLECSNPERCQSNDGSSQ